MTPGDRAICALRASVMTALHNHHAERQRALGEGRTTADAVMAQMAEALRMVPPAAVGSARHPAGFTMRRGGGRVRCD